MGDPLIKICGVKEAAMGTAAVEAGANYVGIIFHPESPRHVELKEAVKIAQAIHSAGGIPIAVFVNQSITEMRSICEVVNIKSIQLHGTIARKNHHLLPSDYQRFYVQTELQNEDDNLSYLDKDRDFILIDQIKSDRSKSIDWKTFHYSLPFRWFLAGGLTSDNIQTAIAILQPDGVDVSSGVESSAGNKDIGLIKKFIQATGNHYAA